MKHCCPDRQEKYREDLCADTPLYLGIAHADLLHDGIPFLVLIAFRNLLIKNDQHRNHEEHRAQKQTDNKQTAI